LPVRWGQQITRKKRRSIRLGSYNHVTTEIRIHPLLMAPDIPAFFIQSVIHHEYLHHVLGASHNRRLHKEERKFRYYRDSKEWIRRDLGAVDPDDDVAAREADVLALRAACDFVDHDRAALIDDAQAGDLPQDAQPEVAGSLGGANGDRLRGAIAGDSQRQRLAGGDG